MVGASLGNALEAFKYAGLVTGTWKEEYAACLV